MRYGSVCSGIEAASAAWEPLGWKAAWFSEIEPFPSAVLSHHWPCVPNLGNMLALPELVASGEIEAPDVLVGGTPCQAFSVAGKRGSLEDERGALTLAYVELANEIDAARTANGNEPCIIVWENVPGVLNTKDNAFGCFLGALAGEDVPLESAGGRWTNAGCVFGPKRTVAWRTLDAQYFGVAQRRRRVFVVASARGGFDPTQVLFEFEGLRRDTPPSREAGEVAAADAGTSTAGSHWDNVTNPHPSLNQSHNTGGIGASNQELFSQRGSGITWPADIASTLNAAFGSKQGLEDQHVNGGCPLFVPISFGWQNSAKQGDSVSEHVTPTLDKSKTPAVCTPLNTQLGLRGADTSNSSREGIGIGNDGDPSFTLQAAHSHAVITTSAVRRLTPRECERLQGFSDDHTLVPYRNKDAADGPRYKALGNSMAVPVMRWIGERINKMELMG